MPWALFSVREFEKPKLVGEYESGDAAKRNARYHQSGLGYVPRYEVHDPGGNLWVHGMAKYTKRGFRMEWKYPRP